MSYRKLLIVIMFSLLLLHLLKPASSPPPITLRPHTPPGYLSLSPAKLKISIIADHLSSPTQVKLLPDHNTLIVTQASGQLISFKRISPSEWARQFTPLTISLSPVENPPAGTYLLPSSTYSDNHRVYLTTTHNQKLQIITTQITDFEGNLKLNPPTTLFQSTTRTTLPTHQFLETSFNSQPHLLLFLPQADTNPPSYHLAFVPTQSPTSPPTHTLATNLIRPTLLAQIPDTDQFLVTHSPSDTRHQLLLFPLSPKTYAFDTRLGQFSRDSLPLIESPLLYSFPTQLTPSALAFHPGNPLVDEASDPKLQHLLIALNSTSTDPSTSQSEIHLGKLSYSNSQPTLQFTPLITRQPGLSPGFISSLEVDQETDNILFLDREEGRLYLGRAL